MDVKVDQARKDRSVCPDAQKIIAKRKAKNWTVEDLLQRSGCSRVTIEKVEQGRKSTR